MERITLRLAPRAGRPRLTMTAVLLGGFLAACESTTPAPTSPAIKDLKVNADITPFPGCNVNACNVPPRILFVSERAGNPEIYSMKYNGTEVVRLTYNSAVDNYPSWSPDYSKLAFVSTRTGSSQIFTMNADGSNVTQLTSSGQNSWPHWSPDGTKIVFHRTYDQQRYQIYTMNANGGQQTIFRYTTLAVSEGQPTWSPDGQTIAFKSNVANPTSGAFDIFTMKVGDPSSQRRVTTTLRASHPAFSPDGTQIAFVTDPYGTVPKGIYVVNAAGGIPNLVTTSKGVDDYPTFRPDGKRIAFMSSRAWGGQIGGKWSIFTINLDGTFLNRPSASIFVHDMNPSWSTN